MLLQKYFFSPLDKSMQIWYNNQVVRHRGIAQLVEQRTPNPCAEGSIPSAPANLYRSKLWSIYFAACSFSTFSLVNYPCACKAYRVSHFITTLRDRFAFIASFGYAYRFTVMHLDRSKPYPVSYLKRKSMEVDLEAQTGCHSGCDGCAGYVPTPRTG